MVFGNVQRFQGLEVHPEMLHPDRLDGISFVVRRSNFNPLYGPPRGQFRFDQVL